MSKLIPKRDCNLLSTHLYSKYAQNHFSYPFYKKLIHFMTVNCKTLCEIKKKIKWNNHLMEPMIKINYDDFKISLTLGRLLNITKIVMMSVRCARIQLIHFYLPNKRQKCNKNTALFRLWIMFEPFFIPSPNIYFVSKLLVVILILIVFAMCACVCVSAHGVFLNIR